MFYLCFGTLFMHFLELNYLQDAAVTVLVFCCFWFQKSNTGNILENGRDKNQKSYNCRDNTEDREGVEDTQQGGHTHARQARPRAGPRLGMVGPPWPPPYAASPPI